MLPTTLFRSVVFLDLVHSVSSTNQISLIMTSHQVRTPAWTSVRTAVLIDSFAACALTSDRRKQATRVNLQINLNLLQDDSSTQHDDESTPRISPTPSSPPTDRLVLLAVKKIQEIGIKLVSLQNLLAKLQTQNGGLSEHTYKPQWPIPWPSKLRAARESYKTDDKMWRRLRSQFANHCSQYSTVQPGSLAFEGRLQITINLGDAAIKTGTGRLQFLAKYPAAFPTYEKVRTHIYEGSQALQSANDAVNELTRRLKKIGSSAAM